MQEKGGQATIAELDEVVIRKMNLPDEITQIMHKESDKQSEIEYRIAWGRTYLKKCGLITNVSRGAWAVTDKFDGDVEKIDIKELLRKVRNDYVTDDESKITLTGFESAVAFQNMVKGLLKELVNKEGKRIQGVYSDLAESQYDIILPDGLEEKQEEIKCAIVYMNERKQDEIDFYNNVQNLYSENSHILLITNILVSEQTRRNLWTHMMIWDKNDLLKRINPEESYAQYLFNPQQALIEEVVTTDNSSEEKRLEREAYIKQAKAAFRKQDMVLFLGAGVLRDGIAVNPDIIKNWD